MELRIGETIAAARRAKDMTQQMLAEAVGVSIAAVSKWETSASYPDITLLPPIARTLGLTLNELFRFHEAPTREMLTAESERLSAVFEQQGFAAGQAACETLLHQYPSCGALKSVIGALYFRFLGAALLERPDNADSFSQRIYCEILSLLEAAEQQSDDLSEALSARMLQVSVLMAQRKWDAAKRLLDTFPKQLIDPEPLYPTLYLEQGALDEAELASQQALFRHIAAAGMALSNLSTVARRRGSLEQASELATLYGSLDALFGLPGIAPWKLHLHIALDRGDIETALSYLKQYADAALQLPHASLRKLPLFSRLGSETSPSSDACNTVGRLILHTIETEEPFTLLAREPRYQTIVQNLRNALKTD